MDGGQGSLEVDMNLFDPEDMNNDIQGEPIKYSKL